MVSKNLIYIIYNLKYCILNIDSQALMSKIWSLCKNKISFHLFSCLLLRYLKKIVIMRSRWSSAAKRTYFSIYRVLG